MAYLRRNILFGIDVGKKKTGLAIANTISRSARPLAVVTGHRDSQIAAILTHLQQWQPGTLIIGLPRHMDGSEHAMTQRVRRFAAQLARCCPQPIHFCDERLSSDMARRLTDTDIDATAAAIILQDWLLALPPRQ